MTERKSYEWSVYERGRERTLKEMLKYLREMELRRDEYEEWEIEAVKEYCRKEMYYVQHR